MSSRSSLLVLALVALSCGEQPPSSTMDGGTPPSGTDAGFDGTGARVTFCEVQALLQSKCWSCHGTTPLSGAPQLITKADLLATSPRGGRLLDRSIARMQELPKELAMPPGLGGTEADVDLFIDFANSGTPDCSTGPVDAGTPTLVCTSGTSWNRGNNGDERMNPGEACKSCHQTRPFAPNYAYMGTVYPTAHERELCNATNIPAGTAIQILDASNTVRVTIPVNTAYSGNFFGPSSGTGPSPYRARVVVNGQVRSEMLTFQTSGDCNSCHTPTGTNGAPGRIHW